MTTVDSEWFAGKEAVVTLREEPAIPPAAGLLAVLATVDWLLRDFTLRFLRDGREKSCRGTAVTEGVTMLSTDRLISWRLELLSVDELSCWWSVGRKAENPCINCGWFWKSTEMLSDMAFDEMLAIQYSETVSINPTVGCHGIEPCTACCSFITNTYRLPLNIFSRTRNSWNCGGLRHALTWSRKSNALFSPVCSVSGWPFVLLMSWPSALGVAAVFMAFLQSVW